MSRAIFYIIINVSIFISTSSKFLRAYVLLIIKYKTIKCFSDWQTCLINAKFYLLYLYTSKVMLIIILIL